MLSDKQKKMTRLMKAANAYASWFYQSEEEKVKARIRLKLPAHKSLFHALVKEWMEKEKAKWWRRRKMETKGQGRAKMKVRSQGLDQEDKDLSNR